MSADQSEDSPLADAAKLFYSRGASFQGDGFSLLSLPPSPRSLCQPSTWLRPSRANPRWQTHYEFRFFQPSNRFVNASNKETF